VKTLSQERAVGELIFAAAIWGMSFIAVRWALVALDPLWINIFRFGIGLLVGAAIMSAVPRLRRDFRWADFHFARYPGLWLGVTLVLQTYGLKYTSVAKSSFITCLYAVLVPVIGQVFLRQQVPARHYLWVAIALVGAALICQLDSTSLNIGDWLTLACALAAAFQILEVGRISNRTQSAFTFALGQAFWALVPPALLAPFWGTTPQFPLPWLAWAGVAQLSLGATLLAFGIQLRAQRVVAPPLASMLYLLESPFASLFAYFLVSENLTALQGIGAGLILFATACSVAPRRRA